MASDLAEDAMAQVEALRQHDAVLADAIAQLVTRLEETQSTRDLVIAEGRKTVGIDSELLEIRAALQDLCMQGAEMTRANDAVVHASESEEAAGSSVSPADASLRPRMCCAYVRSSTRPGN